jgi:hypothetical protein
MHEVYTKLDPCASSVYTFFRENASMSRKRPQVSINLVPGVYEMLRDIELREAQTKTLICTAALMGLHGMKLADRRRAFQLAKLVDEGTITWERFVEVQALEAKKWDAALEQMIEAAIRGADEDDEPAREPAKRRGKT